MPKVQENQREMSDVVGGERRRAQYSEKTLKAAEQALQAVSSDPPKKEEGPKAPGLFSRLTNYLFPKKPMAAASAAPAPAADTHSRTPARPQQGPLSRLLAAAPTINAPARLEPEPVISSAGVPSRSLRATTFAASPAARPPSPPGKSQSEKAQPLVTLYTFIPGVNAKDNSEALKSVALLLKNAHQIYYPSPQAADNPSNSLRGGSLGNVIVAVTVPHNMTHNATNQLPLRMRDPAEAKETTMLDQKFDLKTDNIARVYLMNNPPKGVTVQIDKDQSFFKKYIKGSADIAAASEQRQAAEPAASAPAVAAVSTHAARM